MNPLVDKAEYDPASFDEWAWLTGSQGIALALTVFGDWIYSHNNAIYMFSPTSAESFEIATVAEEIEWALDNVRERAPWLHPDLLAELDAASVSRDDGKIFHFFTPLFLGGTIATTNIPQLAIVDYFDGMQKLLRQTAT